MNTPSGYEYREVFWPDGGLALDSRVPAFICIAAFGYL